MAQHDSLGIITHTNGRRTDYLFRLSVKAIIRDENGNVLAVKENNRAYWDLPGGGVDHNETIRQAIARELNEEVSLTGDFTHRVIDVHGPTYLADHDFWQALIICEVTPSQFAFSAGVDADDIAFVNPAEFELSDYIAEQRIHKYAAVR